MRKLRILRLYSQDVRFLGPTAPRVGRLRVLGQSTWPGLREDIFVLSLAASSPLPHCRGHPGAAIISQSPGGGLPKNLAFEKGLPASSGSWPTLGLSFCGIGGGDTFET